MSEGSIYMKKVLLIAIAAMAVFGAMILSGCGKTIEGSCASVVSQCQDLKANESATITVTGRERYGMDSRTGMTFLSDSGNPGEPYVVVYFADKNHKPLSGRVTISGRLKSDSTKKDNITITDAQIKS